MSHELVMRNRKKLEYKWATDAVPTDESSRLLLGMWGRAEPHVLLSEVSRGRGDARHWAKQAVYAARERRAGASTLVQFEDALWKALEVVGVAPESIGLHRVAPQKRPASEVA